MRYNIILLLSVISLLLTGCAADVQDNEIPAAEAVTGTEAPDMIQEPDFDEVTILTARPDPEIEVTAEELEKELSYRFIVPEGAENVIYFYDTESKRGTMTFYLDGVYWDAKVIRTDSYFEFNRKYIDEYTKEIVPELDSDRILQVHGIDPEINYYNTHYGQNDESFDLSAMWYLEEEGLMIALSSYSETPIHTMPVEVFG